MSVFTIFPMESFQIEVREPAAEIEFCPDLWITSKQRKDKLVRGSCVLLPNTKFNVNLTYHARIKEI